jgi:hypothetical protein
VLSAAEAKLGALFYNAKDAAWLQSSLEAMAHPQPPTPIQTDNAYAAGICDITVEKRRSKAMDMSFDWVQDRVRQGHFRVHWRPGDEKLADYFTKHHAPAHHRRIRHQYLQAQQETSTQILTTDPSLAPQSGKGVLIGSCHVGKLPFSVPDTSTTRTSTVPVHEHKTVVLKPQNRNDSISNPYF